MSENLFNYNTSLPFDVIGTDMKTGSRNRVVNKKIPTTVKELAKANEEEYAKTLQDLGGSAGLTPVIPEGLNAKVDPTTGLLVGKDAPTSLIPSTLAKVGDFLSGGLTDFDRMGGGLFGRQVVNQTTGLGGQPEDFYLTKAQKDLLKEQQKFEEDSSKGPLDDAELSLDLMKRAQDELLPGQRKRARAGAIDEFLNYTLTEPVRQSLLDRAGRLASQRYLDTRAIVEGMPSNVQKIMESKSEQQALADAGFAAQAGAIAGQTDAATRMAGLGLQRRFG